MPCLRGYWPEAPNLTYCRRLTARPAVLAKTYGVRTVLLPVLRSAVRNVRKFLAAYSHFVVGLLRVVRDRLGDSSRFYSRPASCGSRLQAIAAVGLGAVQSFIRSLQHRLGIRRFLRSCCDTDANRDR